MQRLVQRLHESDEAAFEEIYRLTHQKIFNFVLRYMQDRVVTRELTQLLFIRLWEKRQLISAEKPLEAQIYVIARNLVIDNLRKKARENKLAEGYAHLQQEVCFFTEETVLFNNLREQFEAVVDSLPQKRREIFILNRQAGLTYQEIAHQLSISPKTVEVQMSKALKLVRAKLSAFLHIVL